MAKNDKTEAKKEAVEAGPATAASEGVTATPEEVEAIKGDEVADDNTDANSVTGDTGEEDTEGDTGSTGDTGATGSEEEGTDVGAPTVDAAQDDVAEGEISEEEAAESEKLYPVGGPLPETTRPEVEPDTDPLVVNHVAPSGAPAGTVIRVSGTGFDKVKSVKVAGTDAEFTVESEVLLSVVVPEDAEGSGVSVKAGKDKAFGNFTVASSILW